jgi:tetratricopeptide (TPR) repeat protein
VDDYLYKKHQNQAQPNPASSSSTQTTTISPLKTNRSASFFLKKRFLIFSIAAAMLLLISFTVVWLMMFNEPSNDHLYAAYYKALPAPIEMRGAETTSPDPFVTALSAYTSRDFGTAFQGLSGIPENSPNYVPANLFAGLSAMENAQYDVAIRQFNQVLAAGETNLSGDAQWYLALCYLKLGDFASAKKFLEALSSNAVYAAQAKSLLAEMQ